jgi:hypothetical protein
MAPLRQRPAEDATFVGAHHQSTLGPRSKSSVDSGPSARIRSRIFVATSAFSARIPCSNRGLLKCHDTLYHGSSLVGSSERPLLYASNSSRRP